MKKILMMILSSVVIFVIIFIFIFNFLLITNKTFYKATYKTINNQEIFIPRFSYFDSECCMTAATFYSLKDKTMLEREIDAYLSDFTYFNNSSTYGYIKDDIFIQSYEVVDLGLYRKIIIVY